MNEKEQVEEIRRQIRETRRLANQVRFMFYFVLVLIVLRIAVGVMEWNQ